MEVDNAATAVLLLRALDCGRAEVMVEEDLLGRTKAWVLAQAATRQATAMTELRMLSVVVKRGDNGRQGNRVRVIDMIDNGVRI